VSANRGRSIIDVRSVESNTVFTQEQIRNLPVARDVNSVALLAPGVVKGDAGLGAGGIPSFGGASVAENGYYINGFDVTNIRNFLSYADLPFDAIGEQQIKTGGYGVEYGRSLGGVISLSTKRGTNEWKGGTSVSGRLLLCSQKVQTSKTESLKLLVLLIGCFQKPIKEIR
jgi:hypothetical protein